MAELFYSEDTQKVVKIATKGYPDMKDELRTELKKRKRSGMDFEECWAGM